MASLVDCHAIWTATTFATPAERRPPDGPPDFACVTGSPSVDRRAPTPLGLPVRVRSWPEGEVGETVRVRSEVGTVENEDGTSGSENGETASGDSTMDDDTVTATGEVVAVRVGGVEPAGEG